MTASVHGERKSFPHRHWEVTLVPIDTLLLQTNEPT